MSIRRWSKIWTLGDRYTANIFDGPVSITEKLDGSQLNFGIHPEQGLMFLTKGSSTHLGDGNKLFHPAVEYIHTVEDRLVPGWTYHAENFCGPRQNTLVYDHPPKNFLALYGVSKPDGTQITDYDELHAIADSIGIDVVPELFSGVVDPDQIQEMLEGWLDSISYLGKEHIEGIVIKNYAHEQFVGGQLLPLTQAKFVSEKFKEKHSKSWPTNNKSPLVLIGNIVRTEARWKKAIQRLQENNEWEQHPRDIGKLLKILHTDMEEEDIEDIKDRLWKAFSKDIKRSATRGFPEAYKWFLATGELKMDVTGDDFRSREAADKEEAKDLKEGMEILNEVIENLGDEGQSIAITGEA